MAWISFALSNNSMLCCSVLPLLQFCRNRQCYQRPTAPKAAVGHPKNNAQVAQINITLDKKHLSNNVNSHTIVDFTIGGSFTGSIISVKSHRFIPSLSSFNCCDVEVFELYGHPPKLRELSSWKKWAGLGARARGGAGRERKMKRRQNCWPGGATRGCGYELIIVANFRLIYLKYSK